MFLYLPHNSCCFQHIRQAGAGAFSSWLTWAGVKSLRLQVRVSIPATFRRANIYYIQGIWFCKFISALGKCIVNSLILQIQNICSSSSCPARQKDPNWRYRETCCDPCSAVTLVGDPLPINLWNCLSTSHSLWLILIEYRPIKANSSSGFLSHFFRDSLFKIFFLNRTSGFRDWAKKAYLTLLIMEKFVP